METALVRCVLVMDVFGLRAIPPSAHLGSPLPPLKSCRPLKRSTGGPDITIGPDPGVKVINP